MRKVYSSLVGLLFALILSTGVLADSINWQPYSKAAFEQAAKEHKLVLVFGKASWCHWCQKMRDEILSNPGVVSLINSKFIPIKVDVDNNMEIAKQFAIDGFPTFIIFNSNQKIIKRHTGYLPLDETKNMLNGV